MSSLHVVFKVAGAEYVVPAADVLHMETYTGATAVPGTSDHVAGLMQIRQRVIPIIDLRRRFGLPDVAPCLDTRVIVVQHKERTVGMVVDSAREVMHIAADKFAPPPEAVAQQAKGYIKSVAQAGTRLMLLINFPSVIGDIDEETVHGN